MFFCSPWSDNFAWRNIPRSNFACFRICWREQVWKKARAICTLLRYPIVRFEACGALGEEVDLLFTVLRFGLYAVASLSINLLLLISLSVRSSKSKVYPTRFTFVNLWICWVLSLRVHFEPIERKSFWILVLQFRWNVWIESFANVTDDQSSLIIDRTVIEGCDGSYDLISSPYWVLVLVDDDRKRILFLADFQ